MESNKLDIKLHTNKGYRKNYEESLKTQYKKLTTTQLLIIINRLLSISDMTMSEHLQYTIITNELSNRKEEK